MIQFLSVHNKGGQFLKGKHNEEDKKPPPFCTIATELKAVSKYTTFFTTNIYMEGNLFHDTLKELKLPAAACGVFMLL